MNEKDKSSPSTSEILSKPKDEVWQLAEQWMSKVATAYDNHRGAVRKYNLNVLLAFVFISVMILAVVAAIYFFRAFESSAGTATAGILISIAVLFSAGSVFDAIMAFRNMRNSKSDLADIFLIADELFQMVISTEEKNTANRYEYLVNHIRILEIKHLLRKVRAIVGRLGTDSDSVQFSIRHIIKD